jgi:ribosome-binding ATPase YchF (GTP1/OBG family)
MRAISAFKLICSEVTFMAFQVTKGIKKSLHLSISRPLTHSTQHYGLNLPSRRSETHKRSQETMTKITNLKKHLREMQIHSSSSISDEVATERKRLQEEKESTEQCLAICAMASEHLRDKVAAQRERLQEEKESTEQCLAICAKAVEHIGQLQSNFSEKFSRDISIPGVLMSSKQATANALQECKDILTNVTVDLEKHIREIKLW